MPIDITVSQPEQGTTFTYQRSGPSKPGKPQVRLSFRYSITNKSKTEVQIARLVGATPVHLVSLDGLIRAKTAAALPRDLEDVKILEAARPKP